MTKANYKKKQQLKNVGTATALTITLATSNVPTLAYAGEFETNVNEEVIIENVVTEEDIEEAQVAEDTTQEVVDTKEKSVEEVEKTEKTIEEEVIVEEVEVTSKVAEETDSEEPSSQRTEKQAAVDNFDLSDWTFNIYSEYVILNEYKGAEKDVVIPGQIEVTQETIKLAKNYDQNLTYKPGSRKVKMGTVRSKSSNDCFKNNRDQITSLEFVEVNKQKVEFSTDKTTKKMYKEAFNDFTAMTNINLIGADVTALPTDMSGMFKGCTALVEANLKGIDLKSVTDMSGMFSGCTALTIADLSGINLQSLTNINGMFNECTALTKVNLSGTILDNLDSITSIFSGCSSIEEVDLSNLNIPQIKTISNMFNSCTSLKKVNLSNTDLSGLTEINNVFIDNATLEEVDLSGANLSGLTKIDNTFKNCKKLKNINLSNITTSPALKKADNMFSGLAALETVNIDGLDLQNVSNIYNMFNGCSSLREVNLSTLNVPKVSNLTNLFLGCSSLNKVTLGGTFDTGLVNKFNNMFKDCTNLRSIDTSLLDTRSAIEMSYMFSDSGVETLDLTNFNTGQVTDMTGMFRNTENLTNITFGTNFKTNNVTKMPFMFCNSNVNSLNLSTFEVSQVEDMTAMFGSLDNIEVLDLSNFALKQNVKMHRMFARHISVPSANATITENQDENLKKELLVIVTDNKIKTHNFEEDYCLPVGLTFNAVGGQFTDGKEVLELKTNVIERMLNETEITTLTEEIVKNVKVPTKYGHEFVAWRDTEPKATSSIIDKMNKTYYAEYAGTPVAGPEEHPVEPDASVDPDGFKPVEDGTDKDKNEVDEEGAGTPVVRPDDAPIEPDASIDPDGFKPVEDGTDKDKNEVDEEGADTPVTLPDDVPVEDVKPEDDKEQPSIKDVVNEGGVGSDYDHVNLRVNTLKGLEQVLSSIVNSGSHISLFRLEDPTTTNKNMVVYKLHVIDGDSSYYVDIKVDSNANKLTDLLNRIPKKNDGEEDNNSSSSTTNPGNGNSSNESISNSGSNNNPQTGDVGVLGSIGLGLTSILGIFINNRKKKK